jgi:hypothetical protein
MDVQRLHLVRMFVRQNADVELPLRADVQQC